MSNPEQHDAVAKCSVEMQGGRTCGRDVWHRDHLGRCMWHSNNSGKNAELFRSEVEAMLERKDYDFTAFVFEGIVPFGGTNFDGPVWFDSAQFRNAAIFADARFGDSVSFVHTSFSGGAWFDRARFGGAVHFVETTFGREARFHAATFKRSAHFVKATFDWPAEFARATFQCRAEFEQARFHGGAEFVETVFADAAGFRGARFAGEGLFMVTEFQSAALFDQAVFEGAVRFVGNDNNGVFSSEADAQFKYAHFDQPERVAFHRVSLGRGRFLGADVRRVEFTDPKWATRSLWGPRWRQIIERPGWLGRAIEWLCSKWPAWLKPRGRFAVWDELAPGEGEKNYALIGKLYRQLKYNYEEQRDPITAGDFHFGEMHMRRFSDPSQNWLLRLRKRDLSFLALYRWISGYGEDYILPLAWIGGVILLFATLFAFIPALALQVSAASGEPERVRGLGAGLLHSVMCFLLRGGRPFEPVHLAGHYVSVVEGIIGPPLIAMFVLALNRRFKR